MNEPILPIEPFNLEPFHSLLQKLNKSIVKRDYQQIVQDASATITEVLHSQLLVLFDVQSQAKSMLGNYTAACIDAQYMIDYAPTLAAGYIRQGNLHSMYGHQSSAIEVYDTGIQRTASSDVKQIERLEKDKATAIAKDNKRMDFIVELPVEVASNIFSELNQTDKVSCLATSKIWRNRLLDCSSAWKALSIRKNEDSLPLMGIAEHIGSHVKTLEIWTDYDPTRKVCMDRMKRGYFNQVNTLRITADDSEFLQSFTYIPASFWQTAHALQNLEFDLSRNDSEITVAQILGSCPTVNELSYSIAALQKLKFGDFSTMQPHKSLTSLKLKAHRITGGLIEPLLQHCPLLKRLIASTCQPTVLNAVYNYCPNIQILAYNAVSQVDRYLPSNETSAGLRVIYANDHGTGRVPYESLMPLLYKSMDTLQNLFVYLPAMSENDRRYVNDNYPNFKLPNVERLSFWPLHGLQQLMLQSIQSTTTLRHLSVASVSDLDRLLSALMNMQPLETFRISHIHTRTHQTSFVRLFEKYALASKSGPSLRSLTSRHCTEITDQVLMSITKIETLQSITFDRLNNVTRNGLAAFFKALQAKPVFIRLNEIECVTDDLVIELTKVETLEAIYLENLTKLTDRGIRTLMDRCSYNLSKLYIKSCPLVSESCIGHAQRRIVVIIE